MKDIKKEEIKRKVFRSENGFEFMRESETHSLYENKSNTYNTNTYSKVDDPERSPSFEQTGGGATAKEEKIVTPDGQELESLFEVFKWLDENYFTSEKSDPVVKTRNEFQKIDEDQPNYANP